METKLIQWNSRSIRNKKQDIIHLINHYHPSILAVQETWLMPGSRFRVPGYACFRDDRNDGRGGAAIFVSRKCIYCLVPIPLHSEYVNVVAVRSSNITFVSVYIPSPTSSAISEFSSIISSLPAPLIILGDFNIHHVSWGHILMTIIICLLYY